MIPLLAPRRGGREPAPFVVGVGRSGTTLLRMMLDAHPELAIPPETHFVPALIERERAGAGIEALLGEITEARTWPDFGLPREELEVRARRLGNPDAAAVLRVFYELYAERHGKRRWGDKTPIYVKRMSLIAGALAEARFVHLIRDGRDVALSRRRRGMGAEKPITDVAMRWRRRIELARKQSRRLRGRYLELRYEDLVADPEPGLRLVCGHCGLGFDPAMLAHHEGAAERLGELGDLRAAGARKPRSGEERLAAHSLVASPATGERSGIWRTEMSEADVAAFERVAGGLLSELGYELACRRA